jgi:isocitrate/isopropylmalate dehydrogenase
MLLDQALGRPDAARAIERAIGQTLEAGHRTPDLAAGGRSVGCRRFADLVVAAVADA